MTWDSALTPVTLLSDLNDGKGVHPATEGYDFYIRTCYFTFIHFASGPKTIQDVIDIINNGANAEGIPVVAAFSQRKWNSTNRQQRRNRRLCIIRDPIPFRRLKIDWFPEESSPTNQLISKDINPVKEESIFTYLIDLRDGLKK